MSCFAQWYIFSCIKMILSASHKIIYRDKTRQITTESAVENARSRLNWELSKRVVASSPAARLPCLRNTCLTCPRFSPAQLAQSQPLVLHKLSSPCLFIEFALRVTSLFVRASSNLNCFLKVDFDEGINLVKLQQWIIIMQLEWYNFPE